MKKEEKNRNYTVILSLKIRKIQVARRHILTAVTQNKGNQPSVCKPRVIFLPHQRRVRDTECSENSRFNPTKAAKNPP